MHNNMLLKSMKYFSESFLPIVFWIALIFAFDTPTLATMTIIAALIHELGHITAIFALGSKSSMPIGRLFGFKIREQKLLSHRDSLIILSAGAFANIITALASAPLITYLGAYIIQFIYVNLATAVSNLLPVRGYDGFGILSEIFDYFELSDTLPSAISALLTVSMTFLSLYLIGKFGSGYWLFAIFFLSVLSELDKRLKSDIF